MSELINPQVFQSTITEFQNYTRLELQQIYTLKFPINLQRTTINILEMKILTRKFLRCQSKHLKILEIFRPTQKILLLTKVETLTQIHPSNIILKNTRAFSSSLFTSWIKARLKSRIKPLLGNQIHQILLTPRLLQDLERTVLAQWSCSILITLWTTQS